MQNGSELEYVRLWGLYRSIYGFWRNSGWSCAVVICSSL